MKNLILVLFAVFFFTSFIFSQTIEWEKLNGPFGGIALSFASFPNGDIFAGSGHNDKGVYFSSDGGTTWVQKNNGINLDKSIDCISIADSGHLIIGTNSSFSGSRIYKSTDYGESWFEVAAFGASCFANNSSGHIYAGKTALLKMQVSDDNGYSWTELNVPLDWTYDIAINNSDHIFITGSSSWRSTDNGANWTQLNTATSGLPSYIGSIAITSEGYLLAGCLHSDSRMGVYKSTDNGDNWVKIKSDIKVEAHGNIVIKDNGDIFVGSSGQGIWKSTDNGNTWTQHNTGLHHFDVRSMHITSNGIVCAGLNGGGIYKSADGGETWTQQGISVGQVGETAISPLNGNLFAAMFSGETASGMSRSTDAGQSWQPINSGLTNLSIYSVAIKNDGVIFIGGAASSIHRSIDNGNTWVKADTGIQPNGNPIEAMTVDADGKIYAANYYGAHKSTNNGSSWVNIGGVGGAKALAFNSLGDLFLASYGAGFWKLPAGDTTWVNLTSNIGASWHWTMFIGSNDYIYAAGKRSEDNGETWITMAYTGSHGASSYAENSVGHLFCGTFNFGSGAFRSTNYGDNWEAINSGFPTEGYIDIRSIAIDSDDYLYAGTLKYSMYKTTTSTVTSVENEKRLPTTFYLEQSYPNPFNPSTVISYQ
jgi:photosystem II stability/assembly factor-like uncharacterized protein